MALATRSCTICLVYLNKVSLTLLKIKEQKKREGKMALGYKHPTRWWKGRLKAAHGSFRYGEASRGVDTWQK